MVEQTRALVLHDGRGADPADRMKGWSDMPADARRRRAMAAALAHDVNELWSLADAPWDSGRERNRDSKPLKRVTLCLMRVKRPSSSES